MKKTVRKKYYQPEIKHINLDREISLMMQSPPTQPGDDMFSTSANTTDTESAETTKEPLKDNNFEDNPFER